MALPWFVSVSETGTTAPLQGGEDAYLHGRFLSTSEQIEQIRETYKRALQQESVLRSDHCCERVGC